MALYILDIKNTCNYNSRYQASDTVHLGHSLLDATPVTVVVFTNVSAKHIGPVFRGKLDQKYCLILDDGNNRLCKSSVANYQTEHFRTAKVSIRY
jgi:hypothetical protein